MAVPGRGIWVYRWPGKTYDEIIGSNVAIWHVCNNFRTDRPGTRCYSEIRGQRCSREDNPAEILLCPLNKRLNFLKTELVNYLPRGNELRQLDFTNPKWEPFLSNPWSMKNGKNRLHPGHKYSERILSLSRQAFFLGYSFRKQSKKAFLERHNGSTSQESNFTPFQATRAEGP